MRSNTCSDLSFRRCASIAVLLLVVAGSAADASEVIGRDGPLSIRQAGRVRVSDADADGVPDLVTAPLVSRIFRVSSYIGQGDRTFSAPVDSSFEDWFRSYELADIDGDGVPDLLVFADMTFRLSRGNGDGTFGAPHLAVTTSGNPLSAVTGDFDRDRRTDVAISLSDGSVQVFFNDGNGAFQEPQVIDEFEPFPAIAAADFDNDGNLDLFVRWSLRSAVIFGQGDGTFAPRVAVTENFVIHDAKLIDWDGDGNTDIIIYSWGSTFVMLNNGRRSFSPGPSHPGSGNSFEVGDFDGDGRADLITVAETASLFLGRSDGEIVLTRETEGRIVESVSSQLVADVDLDGRDDWMLASSQRGMRVFFGDRGRGLNDEAGQFSSSWDQLMVPGDLNGDGVDDIAREDHVLFGSPDGTFVLGPDHTTVKPRRVLDLNGDGVNDLLAIRVSTFIEAYFNDGDGNLEWGWTSERLADPDKIHVGQVNDLVDDIRDFVVLEKGSNASVPYFGNGDGTFTMGVRANVGTDPTSQTMGDFDEDGHLDLVVSRPGSIRIRFGDGNGVFPTFTDLPESTEVKTLGKPDVNHDGHLDLFHTSGRAFHVRLGNGDGTFAAPWTYDFRTELGETRLGDLDADGFVDLAATTFDRLWVFRGNGIDFDTPRITWIGKSDDRPGRVRLPALTLLSLLDAPVQDVAISARGGGLGGGIYVFGSRAYDAVECGDGDVNRGSGVRADVLFVNNTTGAGAERTVVVPLTAPLEIRMEAPPSTRHRGASANATAPFVLYASTAPLSRNQVIPLPLASSSMCFPSPITHTAPANIVRVWNNLGDEETFGSATSPSSPAPSLVESTHGPGIPGFVSVATEVFLQGVILDKASLSGQFAVTNGVKLRIE